MTITLIGKLRTKKIQEKLPDKTLILSKQTIFRPQKRGVTFLLPGDDKAIGNGAYRPEDTTVVSRQ